MKPLSKIGLILLILLVSCAGLQAAEGVSFEVTASPTKLSFEDTLVVKVTVTIIGNEENYDIAELPVPSISRFSLISTNSSSMKSFTENIPTVTRTTQYLFKPLESGPSALPAMRLDYLDTRTNTPSTLESARIDITVAAPQDGAIGFFSMMILAIIILFIIISSIVIYWRVQKRRKLAEQADTQNSAESGLFTKLKRAEAMLAHGKSAETQSAVFDAVVEYITDRYEIALIECDKDQLDDLMAEKNISAGLSEMITKLIESNEKLRFGGLPQSEDDISGIISDLRRLVEQ